MAALDRHSEQSTQTRERLLDAALIEFSKRGFEAASTRTIAKLAQCHQPQINYHFASKEALWEATVNRLFAELQVEIGFIDRIADPSDRFEEMLRRFVMFAARRPELNRIMVAEAMTDGPRLRWLVENYSRAAYSQVLANWREVRQSGQGVDIDDRLVYHLFIGASSLLWANAPEAKLLDPSLVATDESVLMAHADAMVTFFLPGKLDKLHRSHKKTSSASLRRKPKTT
jgi:TetR/AcrR family transcriptional regulator